MAVLHVGGKAKRAQVLAYTPLYFIFSSDTAATSDTMALDKTKFLGGRKASQQLLVKADNNAGSNGVTVSGVLYKKYTQADLPTLVTNAVHQLFLDVTLNSSVVAAGQTINSIYIVSYLDGVSPGGKDIVTTTDLQGNSVKYVVEAVHNLGDAGKITVDGNLNKVLQLILEM